MGNFTRGDFLIHVSANGDTIGNGTLFDIVWMGLPADFKLRIVAGLIRIGIEYKLWRAFFIALRDQARPLGEFAGIQIPRNKLNGLNRAGSQLNLQRLRERRQGMLLRR